MAEEDDKTLPGICETVANMVKDAENFRSDRSADRVRAMEYFEGKMTDTPHDTNRSGVVSRDVRTAIKKIMPSLSRTLFGGETVVQYEPVGEGDEDSADQATDYINYVALPECEGIASIEDAINDAIRLRNGILKWWQKTTIDVKTSTHTGLDEASFTQLVSDDDVTVLEHTGRDEMIDGPEGQMPTPVHDVKIRRRVTTSLPTITAIPLETFLIDPDAINMKDAALVGENMKLRRSDLVRMGYDRDIIYKLDAKTGSASEQDTEERARNRDALDQDNFASKALEELEYYDLLVRVDVDEDGIAELRRMVFAGGLKEENLLEDTEWDEINYADIISERRPHQWEGSSVSDEAMEIQRIKTVLLRSTLDNLYWQNNLQPIVQEGVIRNPDSVNNPQFGQPIMVTQGQSVRDAVGYNTVPMVADKSFAMLSYLDEELTDRTGISDASSGLAPDALQNMTAKASAMLEQGGTAQASMMAACIARSLKPVFKGLLRLVIQHQDKPRMVRLRDEWVTFDPRSWNADMDATVNTGLGAGTRERDMMAVQGVIGLQDKVIASLGPNNPYVKPDQLYNSLAKFVEATGIRNVGMFFTKPDPQEVQQQLEAQANKPDPEMQKVQMQIEADKAKSEGELALKREEMALQHQQKMQEINSNMELKRYQIDQEIRLRQQQQVAEAMMGTQTDKVRIGGDPG